MLKIVSVEYKRVIQLSKEHLGTAFELTWFASRMAEQLEKHQSQ